MATNYKVFADSGSTATTAPPSYDTISASPIECDQSSIFSFRRMKQKRAAVLPWSKIKYYPSDCYSDLRIACMIVNDNAISRRLNLVGSSCKGRHTNGFSGCPPDKDGMCYASIGLQQHSHPARLDAVLLIEAHNQKQAGCVTLPEALKIPSSVTGIKLLVPWRSTDGTDCHSFLPSVLHAKLEITLL
ncbi:hypothetical protein BDR07DRAFT_1395319 [Suillus spraguei]|nr:hypothetical protein BDR07DRAFT_1395319 [Suillus spraguei]